MSGYVSYFFQCWLRRGNARQMAWMPQKFAVTGGYVRLKNDGVWENGWQIVGVGGRLTEEHLLERNQDYKQTRKASDV